MLFASLALFTPGNVVKIAICSAGSGTRSRMWQTEHSLPAKLLWWQFLRHCSGSKSPVCGNVWQNFAARYAGWHLHHRHSITVRVTRKKGYIAVIIVFNSLEFLRRTRRCAVFRLVDRQTLNSGSGAPACEHISASFPFACNVSISSQDPVDCP